jgi:hypothetical protein
MKNEQMIYEHILQVLHEKIPHNPTLAKNITDWLLIDKDAVYRRLRGEVPFSFPELVTIAGKLDVPVDYFSGLPPGKNIFFRMPMINFAGTSKAEYEMIEKYVDMIRAVQGSPDTEYAESSTAFSSNIFFNYRYLARYYMFKWSYQYNILSHIKPYSETVIPERMARICRDLIQVSRHINTTHYLWDHMIFQHHVTDICYFRDIGLITADETLLIKNDLFQLLNFIEELCRKGKYNETGKSAAIYISDISHDNTCSILDIPGNRFSMFKVFALNTISSFDEKVFHWTKNWIYSLLRTSTMISVNNEKQRMDFINRQREIIDSL